MPPKGKGKSASPPAKGKASPPAKSGSPKEKPGSPKGKPGSPKGGPTSPSAKKGSPKPPKGSPKGGKKSPSPKTKGSPKGKKSPKGKQSPASKDASPKGSKAASMEKEAPPAEASVEKAPSKVAGTEAPPGDASHAEKKALIEPWPKDVCLYQQYQAEQITFPDYAHCLSVKTFLYMCGLDFKVEVRTNAEEMSPSGKVPFIQVGAFLVSELDPIIAFVNARGVQLTAHMNDTQRSEMRAYMSMVEKILVNAELYLAWMDDTVSTEVTKPRYGCPYPWPLSWMLPLRKQREINARLSSTGWKDKTVPQVYEEVKTCCQALSERLDKQAYFFGDKPTELDALVFGHLYTLLTTSLPDGQFADIVQKFPNLTDFCQKIDEKYFKQN